MAEIERAGMFLFEAAALQAQLGQREAAIRALEEADYGFFEEVMLRYDPVFDPLRDDPRFRQVIRRVNREWGLNPDGSLPDDTG